MPGDHDIRTKRPLVDGQMPMVDQDTQAADDLQGGQGQRLVIIAVARDRMARGELRQLRMISGPQTSPAWKITAQPSSAMIASARSRPCVSEMTPISIDGSTVRAGDGASRPGSVAGP